MNKERIKIDEGEIRYEFEIHDGHDTIVATFRGPRMGTTFEMELADAEQMRTDLDTAIAACASRCWKMRCKKCAAENRVQTPCEYCAGTNWEPMPGPPQND